MRFRVLNHRPWMYVARLRPVAGVSYCGAQAIVLTYGIPVSGRSMHMHGVILSSAYAVDAACTRFRCSEGTKAISYDEMVDFLAYSVNGERYWFPSMYGRNASTLQYGDRWDIKAVFYHDMRWRTR